MNIPKLVLDLPNRILSVDGKNFLNMSPDEIGEIIKNHATFNYSPMEGVLGFDPGPNRYTLAMRMATPSGFEEKIITDAHSCYSVKNFGHNNHEVIDKLTNFLANEFVVHAQTNTPYGAAFIQAMSELSGMERVFPKVAGTEGPDTAIHAACLYWQKEHLTAVHKPVLVAAKHCFHGRTETARRLYADKEMQHFGDGGDYSQIIKIPFGDIDALKRTFTKYQHQIAAFIVEPIQGEGGVHVPSDKYLHSAVKLCDDWNIVSIFDEVQTGFGRAGYPFYFQKYGDKAKPNIVCFGKAAGAGIIPLSGIAGDDKILKCFKPGLQGSTWSRTPFLSYAGLVAIWYLLLHDLSSQSRAKGEYLKRNLLLLQKEYPGNIAEIRGEGLFVGMELTKKHNPQTFVKRLLLEGSVLSGVAHENTLRIMPPLIIDYKGLDDIVHGIELVLQN